MKIKMSRIAISFFAVFLRFESLARPVSDMDVARFVFMKIDSDESLLTLKKRLVGFLPEDVHLVLFSDEFNSKTDWRAEFSGEIPADRVQLLQIPGSGNGQWPRQEFPVAVVSNDVVIQLVDARSYARVEVDGWLSEWLGLPLIEHGYFVNGSNLISDKKGRCIMAEYGFTYLVPSSVFEKFYGCSRMTRMPYSFMGGPIDESVVFLKDNVVATDNEDWATELQKAGFGVWMLPKPKSGPGYANVLMVNGIVIMPVYGEVSDAIAMRVYLNNGYTVYPVRATDLLQFGRKSLRSLTKTYPVSAASVDLFGRDEDVGALGDELR